MWQNTEYMQHFNNIVFCFSCVHPHYPNCSVEGGGGRVFFCCLWPKIYFACAGSVEHWICVKSTRTKQAHQPVIHSCTLQTISSRVDCHHSEKRSKHTKIQKEHLSHYAVCFLLLFLIGGLGGWGWGSLFKRQINKQRMKEVKSVSFKLVQFWPWGTWTCHIHISFMLGVLSHRLIA